MLLATETVYFANSTYEDAFPTAQLLQAVFSNWIHTAIHEVSKIAIPSSNMDQE